VALTANGSGISYFEYKVINELMHSHIEEFGTDLRAIIAFGPLVLGQETFDIELLEVVNGWPGPELMPFGSTSSLPTRGKLLLHFLPTTGFENLLLRDTQGLTDILRRGYKIIYEVPAGYARHILMHTFGTDENPAGGERFADPLRPLAR
jgi:hypothetical protein